MTTAAQRPRSILPLLAVLAACLAPVVFALLAYYVPSLGLRPAGTTNYGHLIDPQRPMPSAAALALVDKDGKAFDLSALKGQWLLISAGPGACPEACVRRLYVLRNTHASQGKEVERLNRLWFVTDSAPLNPVVDTAYQGTIALRADPTQLAAWLTAHEADPQAALLQRMWVVDPLGNLMMAFPDTEDPEAVRDDIRTLLKNSHIG
ncbi:MAG TPA: SCO family protein [Castellaniella sp.]|nr:SCO family protein [Castellaniella sp.]